MKLIILRNSTKTPEDIKLDEPTTSGWFYPWSINLFDEEIKKIYDSDGIIGVMIDERALGWGLPKYEDKNYIRELNLSLIQEGYFKNYGIDPKFDECRLDSFRKAEAFLRNVFYIVKHSGRGDTTAWRHIGFGSDFDGFINPLDICETSGDVPQFQQFLIEAIPYFLKIHPEYHLGANPLGLLYGLTVEQAMSKLFYDNSRRLIIDYF
jgi:hypothetical protein